MCETPQDPVPASGGGQKGKEEAVEPQVPLIPRKRKRKGYRHPPKKPEPDPPEEKSEEPPIPRLTRAAIKAEEEALDTMEVLSALAGEQKTIYKVGT